uniref:Uncharacterized protein n=1 Tax=Ananas comosus var. bracteatus TaxID=296719 RepID=A0A6V7QAA5_ANACO|nr:unnamed protein product [Ananas comosus var. bracteatus]
MGRGTTEMEVGGDGVAVITINNPPLKENYEQAIKRDDVKAIVLTGAKGRFSGGFDINAFQKGTSKEVKPGFISIDFLTDSVEEVAMACHGRICTSTAQLGLPELQLGIIPGMGGTQRLPRLVGLSKSLEMMLLSKPVKGEEAHSLGLVDAVVSPKELVKAQKQSANLEHPLVCIDCIEEGIVSGPRAGLWKEVDSSKMLQSSQTSKSLVHFFFAQRATSKVSGITDIGLVPRKVRKVAIVGGGLMGSGIATTLILSKYSVILKEVSEKFLQAGIGRVRANLQSRIKKGKMTQESYEKTLSLLTGVLDYEQFRDVDLVIEAVIENVSLKQQIFADLERYCPPACILATNTSTIDLNLVGEKTTSQDRIVGAHFFSPAHIMPLLEIVRTQRTSAQVVLDLLDVAKKIRKTPIVVGNCTGFAVNRMFFPYTQAALLLVDRGLDVYQIDRAITRFGMPMGPFRLADLVGFGVAVATAMQYLQSFPERCYKSMLIPLMLEDKRIGEAARKGFYQYDDKRKASPDPEIKKYVEQSRSMAGGIQDPKLMKLTDKDIVEMVFFPVVNEACRVLDERIALKASDLDIASIMGMGFPITANYVSSRLEDWSKMYGEFFKPCAYLVERAKKGESLGAQVDLAKSRL